MPRRRYSGYTNSSSKNGNDPTPCGCLCLRSHVRHPRASPYWYMVLSLASSKLPPKRECCLQSGFSHTALEIYIHSYEHLPLQLLLGITVALPFLGARLAYAIIVAWSSSDLYGAVPSSNPTLKKLNPNGGDWKLYLVLGPVMEYTVALMYMFASTILAQRHEYFQPTSTMPNIFDIFKQNLHSLLSLYMPQTGQIR